MIFEWHDDFYGGMPMLGIGLIIGIIMKFESFDTLIDDGFFDAV